MAETVVVFDFDRTIIDGDSDNWVVSEMGLSQLFNQLHSTMPWNSLMDHMIKELHSQGKRIQAIADCLKRVPLHPRIIAAIQTAFALGCDLKIVSDANQFYIETILENHGLLSCFSEIITNPSFIDDHGRLRILSYQDPSNPHGCCLCPSNLCKGLVIEQMRSFSEIGKKRFIYLGDGSGDFCPTLKLREGDHVMPRQHYPLWKRICNNATLIRAEVHEWANGEELEEILIRLIKSFPMEGGVNSNSYQFNPSKCKLAGPPATTDGALPHTLDAPH